VGETRVARRITIATSIAMGALLAAAPEALAQPHEPAAAADDPAKPSVPDADSPDALFQEGTKLLEEKRYAEALAKLEEAQKRDPGLGTLFNIGACLEGLGKLASALRTFEDVADNARAAGKTQRERAARARIEKIAPRVAAIILRPADPGDAQDMILKVDGVILDSSHWPLWPIDPGVHRVEAAAPMKKSWSQEIAAPAEGGRAVITIPKLESAAKTITVTTETTSTRRTLGFIFGGVGAAGVVTATVTSIMYMDAYGIAKDRCHGGTTNQCIDESGKYDQRGADAVNRAKTLIPINIAAFAVAAVGLGVGAYFIWFSEAPKTTAGRSRPLASISLVPEASATGGGLSLRGDL